MAPVVSTPSGELESADVTREGLYRFFGVPFAAPPVGRLRWRPAEEPPRWEGVRPATRFGPAPIQTQPRRNSIMYQANFVETTPLVMSEDCLYLNIWTPELGSAGLPVMVWVPGGGNRFGWGSQSLYDASRLAPRGVVVVTLSYRLGVLGFLAHTELRKESACGAAGNYALTDVLAALRWVQRHIESFGGDPDQVTIFGNSAGAAHISHLMASPLASGLFARAIAQSGSGFRPLPEPDEADAAGARFLQSRGVSTVEDLRNLGAAELVLGGDFGVAIDGYVLHRQTQTAFEAGEQLAVPLVAGTNDDEGSPYASRVDVHSFHTHAGESGVGVKDFLTVYPTSDEEELARSNRRSVSCERFYWPLWKWATTHARTSGVPVWMYRFTHAPPLPADLDVLPPADGAGGYGSFHTAELFYMWDNLAMRNWPWSEEDSSLADLMSSSWVEFARHGDPALPGRGGRTMAWDPIADPLLGPVMYFGATPRLGPLPELAELQLQDRIEQNNKRKP